jgi:ribosomal protein S27AE
MSATFLKILEDSHKSGELLNLISNAYSAVVVAQALGYSKNYRYGKMIRDYCLLHNIDASHFTSNGKEPAKLLNKICPQCNNVFEFLSSHKKPTTCSYDCGNKFFAHTQGAKNRKDGSYSYVEYLNRFYKENNLTVKCCSCNETTILDVHHIDENRYNNELSNLVYLCPTHHAYLHRTNSSKVFSDIALELDNRPLVK